MLSGLGLTPCKAVNPPPPMVTLLPGDGGMGAEHSLLKWNAMSIPSTWTPKWGPARRSRAALQTGVYTRVCLSQVSARAPQRFGGKEESTEPNNQINGQMCILRDCENSISAQKKKKKIRRQENGLRQRKLFENSGLTGMGKYLLISLQMHIQ